MSVQNNHFTTQLQSINRPSMSERPAAHGTSTPASAAPTGQKAGEKLGEQAGAAQAPVSPSGLVGNHVNTTA
jgi:hypothetical protein